MSVIAVSPPEMGAKLKALTSPSLVFFHKQGCRPCGDMMPRVVEISGRYAGRLDVYTVDVTGGAHGTEGYTGGGTPLVVLFDRRGLEEWRWRGGSVTADRMAARIEDVLR